MKDVHAFIVGIDRYDEAGGDWDIEGPVTNACGVAARLLAAGVPAQNIHLFVSETTKGAALVELAAKGLRPEGDAKADTIDTYWRSRLRRGADHGSKLFVFWSGHGVTDRQSRRVFLCSDYTRDLKTRVFNADNFVRQLKGEAGSCFTSQLVFADVCGTYADSPLSVTDEILERPRVVDQLVYYASPDGEYALGDDGIGAFTSALLEGLGDFVAWPSEEEVIDRLKEAFSRLDIQALVVSHFGTRAGRCDHYHVGKPSGERGPEGPAAAALACLDGLMLGDGAIRHQYVKTVGALANDDLYASQGKHGMVHALAALQDASPGKASFGLVLFLMRLARERSSAAIDDWLALYATEQQQEEVRIRLARERPVMRLLIEVSHDSRLAISRFRTYLRNQDLSVPAVTATVTRDVSGWDDFAAQLGEVVEATSLAHPQVTLELDFVVDVTLFDMPFHKIVLPESGDLVGVRFSCLIHYLRRSAFQGSWEQYCTRLGAVRFADLSRLPIAVDRSLPRGWGLCYASFPLSPQRPCQVEKSKLSTALQDGAPYLLWTHGDVADAETGLVRELDELLPDAGTVERIPVELARRRRRRDGIAEHVSLLWDDPKFLPFISAQGLNA